jgi:iron-sulfur cluster assembly protein|tara:strand:+ start:4011 stop:4397 length:387 start_codon:yes stop_codon:yes gene_type:complete
MGILGGGGFSLPVITQTEVVDVKITVTDSALKQMKNTIKGEEDTHCLVVSAQSGGCSGYLYDMKIMEKPDLENFQIQDFEGVKVYIHDNDSILLNGIELDFKDTLMGGGFNITNPNASRACGCGQSFG